MLKAPTFVQLVFGALVSAFEAKFIEPDISVREQIGKYKLVSGPKGRISRQEYAYGIYTYKRKKYFIKTWYGTFSDARFYALIHEYVANKILYRKLPHVTFSSGVTVRVAEAREYYKTRRSASIVYEYIDGISLTQYTDEIQADVITRVIDSLKKVSKTLREKETFPRRTFEFYLAALPFHTVKLLWLYPREYKTIIGVSLMTLNKLFSERKTPLVIAHRDLTPEHIMMTESNAYIVDLSAAAFTFQYYDEAMLSLHAQFSNIFRMLPARLKNVKSHFLYLYLSLKIAAMSQVGDDAFDLISKAQEVYQLRTINKAKV